MPLNDYKEGDIIKSKNGDFIIIKKNNARNVLIKFIESGWETTVQSIQITNGNPRDVYGKYTYGVGYLGEGKFKTKDRGKLTRTYRKWSAMLERCYCPKYHQKRPTYKNVTVCEEWHNYQNFAKWFEENYIEGYELDKDRLQQGIKNKVYSPSTCCFLSKSENSREAMNNRNYKQNPIIVIKNEQKQTIISRVVFAERHGYNVDSIYKLISGAIKQYDGWKLY